MRQNQRACRTSRGVFVAFARRAVHHSTQTEFRIGSSLLLQPCWGKPRHRRLRDSTGTRDGRGKSVAARLVVGPTDQTFTCAARAHVDTAARRTACLHVSRAMQAARRRSDFDFTSRLGRRTEAGPRQVLWRVRRLGLAFIFRNNFIRSKYSNVSLFDIRRV